jgi:hypothetical protein
MSVRLVSATTVVRACCALFVSLCQGPGPSDAAALSASQEEGGYLRVSLHALSVVVDASLPIALGLSHGSCRVMITDIDAWVAHPAQ